MPVKLNTKHDTHWSLHCLQVLQQEFGKYASYASCESLRVVASDFSLGVSPTFVTIALLLPANYSIFR